MTDSQNGTVLASVWRLLAMSAGDRTDAIRLACVLEATAPKVGNVHPAARFHDLSYTDFVLAACATAQSLGALERPADVDSAIAAAVAASVAATGTNVNLGIVLLLAPLVASEPASEPTSELAAGSAIEKILDLWQTNVAEVLDQLTLQQGASIAASIAASGAGGLRDESLGSDHPLDVTGQPAASYDLIAAMRLAAKRDRIALQYADDFRDLFQSVVPTLRDAVAHTGDLLSGIVLAHLTLIAGAGDSLIARKSGDAQSARVASLANACLAELTSPWNEQSLACIQQLDTSLRADGNRLNPGTSADLIAAAIYVLLRVAICEQRLA